MDEVSADRVSPMRARVGRRKCLIEEMPLALPEAEAVGVVQIAFGADKVIEGAIGVGGHDLA